MNVHILSVAQREVEEASDFFEDRRERLGDEFFLAFEKALKDICLYPKLGSWLVSIARSAKSLYHVSRS
jgi:hypothetical protein